MHFKEKWVQSWSFFKVRKIFSKESRIPTFTYLYMVLNHKWVLLLKYGNLTSRQSIAMRIFFFFKIAPPPTPPSFGDLYQYLAFLAACNHRISGSLPNNRLVSSFSKASRPTKQVKPASMGFRLSLSTYTLNYLIN